MNHFYELQHQLIPQNSFYFIVMFMRVEYTLKKLKYASQSGKSGESIKIDWNEFCNKELPLDFFCNLRHDENVKYLIEQPPRKQKMDSNRDITWGECDPPQNTQQLFEAIRRVRNNLFHGGKSDEIDNVRNEKLIEAARIVLEQALFQSPRTRKIFDGG